MKKYLLLTLSFISALNAQNLQTTINEVLSTNPAVLERLKNYNSTKEDIKIAKAGYYPKLDLSLGAGYENNQKKDWDDQGSISDRGVLTDTLGLSVYQNSITYTQNLFNGFGTTYKVSQQQNRTISAAYSYIEKANATSFEAVNKYLQVVRQTELLQTAKENVDINRVIFKKVQKLYDAGLTTLSEVNKIESSLALAESNYVVQENTLQDVEYNMQRVLGRYLKAEDMSKPSIDVTFPDTLEDATEYAMQHNPSLLISRYNIKLAQDQYKEKKSPFYPKLDIEVSQSMNKNLSAIEGTDNRFRAMAYLKYNFFNGFADSAALQQSVSHIHQEVQTKNDLRRKVIEGLNLAWAANEKLGKQLAHLQDYKKFSLKTLKLYTKEYDLGRSSLLDLLSAQNDFIGAKAQIINTQYSMLFAKYRILDAMGTLVSTVANGEDVYANVGLKGQTPKNKDILPVVYDRDNDLIVDENDICHNSLADEMKDMYGCKTVYEDTQRIERYSGFIFENSSANLSDEGLEKLNDLIKQIKPYGMIDIKFDIIGNVDDDEISDEKAFKLSQKRANKVKNKLIAEGALEDKITTYPKGKTSPMYSNESGDSIKRNNRVDIVVRKLKK
jgi:adhesin transport system outer membrane protein